MLYIIFCNNTIKNKRREGWGCKGATLNKQKTVNVLNNYHSWIDFIGVRKSYQILIVFCLLVRES